MFQLLTSAEGEARTITRVISEKFIVRGCLLDKFAEAEELAF